MVAQVILFSCHKVPRLVVVNQFCAVSSYIKISFKSCTFLSRRYVEAATTNGIFTGLSSDVPELILKAENISKNPKSKQRKVLFRYYSLVISDLISFLLILNSSRIQIENIYSNKPILAFLNCYYHWVQRLLTVGNR